MPSIRLYVYCMYDIFVKLPVHVSAFFILSSMTTRSVGQINFIKTNVIENKHVINTVWKYCIAISFFVFNIIYNEK